MENITNGKIGKLQIFMSFASTVFLLETFILKFGPYKCYLFKTLNETTTKPAILVSIFISHPKISYDLSWTVLEDSHHP